MGFHIVKRDTCPLWKKLCFYTAAVLAALVLGGLLLMAMGVDPAAYYTRMLTLGLKKAKYPHKLIAGYLADFVPLVLTAVGLSLAFKMRFWNIGGEGQFIMGAIAASAVALKLQPPVALKLGSFAVELSPSLAKFVTLLFMCLAAMLAAGLYGLFVAWLKVKFGTNETLLTLMLNYIALYFLIYLKDTKAPWNFFLQQDVPRPVFEEFNDWASFPSIMFGKFGLSLCVILTFAIGALIFVYLKYTKRGYEISVVGDSMGTAHYAGMKVNTIVLRTVFLSACLIGLAAAFKMGTVGQLSDTITNDVGWTGIIVAWLAQLNTFAIFVVSALISLLHRGSQLAVSSFPKVNSSFADLLQGLILFLVLAAEFFIRFRIARNKKGGSDR